MNTFLSFFFRDLNSVFLFFLLNLAGVMRQVHSRVRRTHFRLTVFLHKVLQEQISCRDTLP